MAVQIINSPSSHYEIKSSFTMKKKIIVAILFAIIASVGVGYYLYNKPHQSIADETPAFNLDAKVLVGDYEKNEKIANDKYLGKIVEVRGIIAEKSRDKKGNFNITLQGADLSGVGCEFEKGASSEIAGLKEGQEVKIKGICTGVLMDVVLVDCVYVTE
jgi:tRNA_anti-like